MPQAPSVAYTPWNQTPAAPFIATSCASPRDTYHTSAMTPRTGQARTKPAAPEKPFAAWDEAELARKMFETVLAEIAEQNKTRQGSSMLRPGGTPAGESESTSSKREIERRRAEVAEQIATVMLPGRKYHMSTICKKLGASEDGVRVVVRRLMRAGIIENMTPGRNRPGSYMLKKAATAPLGDQATHACENAQRAFPGESMKRTGAK